jgi:hypothetical protein
VYYVDQRAYVNEVIRQLEGWLLYAHHTQTCPFCRAMIWVGLNGHVDEDALHSLVGHDQDDGLDDGYDRQDGPGDVWPGNEAPGDEKEPESAASGGVGQAETQPAQGPADDGLEGGAHAARRWEEACGGGGGGGESSSQWADVEVGPSKGEQVVLPRPLR